MERYIKIPIEKNIVRKKLFIRFLKENNCYNEYIFNFILNKEDKHFKYNFLDELLKMKIDDDTNEILDAFPWRKTYEGYDYWSKLDKKWQDFFYFNKDFFKIEKRYEEYKFEQKNIC